MAKKKSKRTSQQEVQQARSKAAERRRRGMVGFTDESRRAAELNRKESGASKLTRAVDKSQNSKASDRVKTRKHSL